MKVYVAGKFHDVAAVRAAQAALVAAGHTITYDWTAHMAPPANASPEEVAAERRASAKADLDGVIAADALVALFTDATYPYRGTFTEIGAALALGRIVIAIDAAGPRPSGAASHMYETNVFLHHPGVTRAPSVAAVADVLAVLGATA